MNTLIAIVVGAVVALAGTLGGVAAYKGSTHAVPKDHLYSYTDN